MANDGTRTHGRRKVLILSAAVGGGHEAAARNLEAALDESGQETVVMDALALMSLSLNWFLISVYAWQLRHLPWLCGVTFRLTNVRWVVLLSRVLIGWICGRRLLRAISGERPDLIVSTYPVVTSGLGRLVRSGRLPQPVIATITDYGAHQMWVSPDIDLHLVLSRRSAEMVRLAGGAAEVARLPVGRGFPAGVSKAQARAELAIDGGAFVVLIVGGAWGIGSIDGMVDCVAAAGASAIVVTGQNGELRERLAERFRTQPSIRIMGWTDQMPLLMAASDCILQNAGGVTSIEAIEVGLPIVFYRPIPGHGMLNGRVMVAAGAAHWAGDDRALESLLRDAASGRLPLAAAAGEPRRDAIEAILSTHRARIVARRRAPLRRWAAAATVLAVTAWASISPWGMTLAREGGWSHFAGHDVPAGSVSVVVRTDDPAVAAALARWTHQHRLPITLFVNAEAASGLVPTSGVTIGISESPGGRRAALPWIEWSRVRSTYDAVELATGVAPTYFLPGLGQLDAVDLAIAPPHTRLVAVTANAVDRRHGGIVAIETRGLDSEAAIAAVQARLAADRRGGLREVPLSSLP